MITSKAQKSPEMLRHCLEVFFVGVSVWEQNHQDLLRYLGIIQLSSFLQGKVLSWNCQLPAAEITHPHSLLSPLPLGGSAHHKRLGKGNSKIITHPNPEIRIF